MSIELFFFFLINFRKICLLNLSSKGMCVSVKIVPVLHFSVCDIVSISSVFPAAGMKLWVLMGHIFHIFCFLIPRIHGNIAIDQVGTFFLYIYMSQVSFYSCHLCDTKFCAALQAADLGSSGQGTFQTETFGGFPTSHFAPPALSSK